MGVLGGFYEDRRFCPACGDYGPYLLSPERGYCVACGGVVQLFSDEAMARLRRAASESGRRSARTPGPTHPARLAQDGAA